jgi:hypothetical protein
VATRLSEDSPSVFCTKIYRTALRLDETPQRRSRSRVPAAQQFRASFGAAPFGTVAALSLNVAVSVAMAAGEMIRQRRPA